MNDYLKQWNRIIMNCNFDNTYKMAWGKSLVEMAIIHSSTRDIKVVICFEEIAELCLKYYWNQTIYFDLIQGANLKKIPEIVQYVKLLITWYYEAKGDSIPERFERIDFAKYGMEVKLSDAVKKTVATLKQDVCYRFPKVNGEEFPIYTLDKKAGIVIFRHEDIITLATFSDLLLQIINYRWTQMLESYNHSPRISMKVRVIDEGKIRRNNLTSFHQYLDMGNDANQRYCFYCGHPISDYDLSVDHVIPWSFMFSDDLWNLVYCHRSENSSKSNSVPDEDTIIKLEDRNVQLLERMKSLDINFGKTFDSLALAVEKDYVRKFWIGAKG